ncbi:hypothetical protein QCE88_28300 [Caballeronia sp. LZ035]|nr:hypothetical protein [Caballeronia sp. LZ035]
MNEVARNVMPVLMVADADQAPCVVAQRNAWLPPNASNRLSMRLAVKEAEAWVLADHIGFSRFAAVSKDLFPALPETDVDPKQRLLSLVKKSKRRELRDEMLPGKGATSPVGLGYNVHMTDFVRNHWSVGAGSCAGAEPGPRRAARGCIAAMCPGSAKRVEIR